MFARAYYALRYFAARFWPQSEGTAPPAATPTRFALWSDPVRTATWSDPTRTAAWSDPTRTATWSD